MYKQLFNKALVLSLLSLTFFQAANAQIIVNKSLDFGNVNVGKKDSVELNIDLGKNTTLKVFVRLYGESFLVRTKTKEIKRGGDTSIWVVFKPEQNLAYNGEIFIGYDNKWFLRADLVGNGKLANNYYKSTFNLWDNELKAELKKITSSGQKSLGYNGARDEMYGDLDNYSGKVTCVYTGRTATFNSRGGANSNSFNCEHTWPQSKFCSSDDAVMKADIHHLFSTDVNANSRRSSYPFGKVTGSVTWQEGGSKLGGGVFEPRDEQKGATARAMLYMLMRYGNCASFLNDQEDFFRDWSATYLPTKKETDRNDGIFDLQKNRNPFVDAPFFVDRITSFGGNATRKTAPSVVLVDTVTDELQFKNDSAIYIAYLVNTGTAPFEINDITGDFSNYTLSSNTANPGERIRIRYAFKGRVTGLYNSLITFKQSSLQTVEVMFEPQNVGVFNAENAALIKIEGNQVVSISNEPYFLTLYSVTGQELYSSHISSNFNLSALPYKGFAIIRVETKNRSQTAKVFLR